jgi:hypothetical protein
MDPNQTPLPEDQTPPAVPTFTPPTAWANLTPPSASATKYPPYRPEPMSQEPVSPPIPQIQPQPATTAPSSSKSGGFLRLFFIGLVLILFGILIGVVAARFLPIPNASVVPTPTPTVIITPSVTTAPIVTPVSTQSSEINKSATGSSSIKYTCPTSGWVDCMPGPEKRPECSAEAMSWYKTNCPNFQGGAL